MNIITKAKTAASCGFSASLNLVLKACAFALALVVTVLQSIGQHLAALALAVTAFFLFGTDALAQATPTTTLTTGITEIITEGTVVGIAALGIFVAFVTIMVIKKFFFAGK